MAAPREETLSVTEREDRMRLDRVVAARLPSLSRSRIQRLARDGMIRVDGEPARPSRLLRAGETVRISVPAAVPSRLEPEPIPLSILHEDEALVVLVKPAGMVVHPGAGASTGTLVHALLARGRGWSTIGGEERPGIVHRLDRGTSGVMLVARDDRSHRILSDQFKQRTVEKIYNALVWGGPREGAFEVDLPLGRDRVLRRRISARTSRPRDAATRFRLLERMPRFAWLEARPLTGRTHQIRAHLRSAGLPIVGDREYGGCRWKELPEGPIRQAFEAFGRLALHARRLAFDHPLTGARMTFEAPIPEEVAFLLELARTIPRGAAGVRP